MNKWEIIFIASAVTVALRTFPFIFFRLYSIPNNGKLAEFLSYSSNAVIGGIIYSALYGTAYYHDLLGHFDYEQIIKFLIIVIAFFVAIRTKAIFKTLAICIAIYAAFLLISL